MKEPVQISSLHLFIINIIRQIRLDLGITQLEISRILHPDSSSNALGGIESNFRPDKYTDENLNKIAKAFTDKSFALGLNTTYTIYDFYPKEAIEEKMVTKNVIETPKELKQTGVLHLLLIERKEKFFDNWHTVSEIAAFCGNHANKTWTNNDFTAIVKIVVDDNKLIRKSEEEALFKRP